VKIAVLGNVGSWYVDDLMRVGTARGHRIERCDFRLLLAASFAEEPVVSSDGCNLASMDAVIVRTMPPGSLEQVVYRMDALAILESYGITVLNPPKAIECAVDKYLAGCRLQQAGLPFPPTVVCEDVESGMAAFERLGGDVVVKPIFGAEGRGIVRVSDPDLAYRTFKTLSRLQAVLYLQTFIHHAGYDIRVLVLDGKIIGGMRRSNRLDFRTNVAQNGTAEVHTVNDDEQDMAIRAAVATGARFAGVDILYDGIGQPFVIEVNAVPGWRAFRRVTNIDVSDHVIAAIEQRQVVVRGLSPDGSC
jgi:ribosomal protein S6--L-glutamate ligase